MGAHLCSPDLPVLPARCLQGPSSPSPNAHLTSPRASQGQKPWRHLVPELFFPPVCPSHYYCSVSPACISGSLPLIQPLTVYLSQKPQQTRFPRHPAPLPLLSEYKWSLEIPTLFSWAHSLLQSLASATFLSTVLLSHHVPTPPALPPTHTQPLGPRGTAFQSPFSHEHLSPDRFLLHFAVRSCQNLWHLVGLRHCVNRARQMTCVPDL